MVDKNKINKLIEKKKQQIKRAERVIKEAEKIDEKHFKEDLKFWNSVNPFYTSKWSSTSGLMLVAFTKFRIENIKDEIKELKSLL